jgi:hypothetical protein
LEVQLESAPQKSGSQQRHRRICNRIIKTRYRVWGVRTQRCGINASDSGESPLGVVEFNEQDSGESTLQGGRV